MKLSKSADIIMKVRRYGVLVFAQNKKNQSCLIQTGLIFFRGKGFK